MQMQLQMHKDVPHIAVVQTLAVTHTLRTTTPFIPFPPYIPSPIYTLPITTTFAKFCQIYFIFAGKMALSVFFKIHRVIINRRFGIF